VAAVPLTLTVGLVSSDTLDGASASPAAVPSVATPNLAKQLLLRLHDLPRGYVLLDPGSFLPPAPLFGCARIAPVDSPPRLGAFLKRYSPRGCLGGYLRLFQIPGEEPAPLFVGSAATELGSVRAAEVGMTISRELLAHLTDDKLPPEVHPPETIGEATRLFHWREAEIIPDRVEKASILVWRWGSSLGLILTDGDSFDATDRAAAELARRQKKHLEAPTPYTREERDDREVPLEDPALELPIYWLGDPFTPANDLPRMFLTQTFSTTHPSPGAALSYTNHLSFDHAEFVELGVWTPQEWRAFRAKKGLPFEFRCSKPHGLDLPVGGATVYSGRRWGWRCDEHGPREYGAVVHFPGAVVTVERLDTCEDCFGHVERPYNSFKGMATIARGLAPRVRPASQLGEAP